MTTTPINPTPIQDVTTLFNALLQLGLDIKKASKANQGVAGYVSQVAQDAVVLASIEQVVMSFSRLPSDFKALGISDYLTLIEPTIKGVQAIIQA